MKTYSQQGKSGASIHSIDCANTINWDGSSSNILKLVKLPIKTIHWNNFPKTHN